MRVAAALLLTVGLAHAEPVYTCPTGGTMPLELPPGCAAPSWGLLYPTAHADDDLNAALALRRVAAAADKSAAAVDKLRADAVGRVSWVWVAVGIVAGAAGVLAWERGAR